VVANRKNPLVSATVQVPGRAQLGYRPPMCVSLTSLKDGIYTKTFQITRVVHKYSTHEGYTCNLNLVASRTSAGAYEPKVAPFLEDLGMSLASRMRKLMETALNDLRNRWI